MFMGFAATPSHASLITATICHRNSSSEGGNTMNRFLFLVPLGALLVAPNFATAQSAFDGTWKVSLNNVDWSKKPDVYVLEKGMYTCKTCTPPFTVKADGSDQAVTGHPYFDTVAIKVVSDHEIQEFDKKGGKLVATSKTVISADGKTATWDFTDSSNTNGGPPVTGNGESELVAKGPAGSHASSGSWRITKMAGMSDNGLVFSYKVTGDTITMNSKSGQSYTAKLDGNGRSHEWRPGRHVSLREDARQARTGRDG
jgi:hypothetical protein